MSYPWQKVYEQHPTIAVSKVIEEAPALHGFTGSWAASYTNGLAVQSELAATEPGHSPAQVNKTGLPGLPEINFAPYAANTNRFGIKGPSLIGHPISYSVVGPTLKSQFCDWQWVVTDNSAFVGNGDVITYDAAYGVFGGAPSLPNILRAYNIFDLTPYPNGLYLIISQTGEIGVMPDAAAGGLGDGFYNDTASTSLTAKDPTSRYEIFRIESINATWTYFTLSPDKRISTYFDFPPATPTSGLVRGVTLFEPKAARLMAVPDNSAASREQVFTTVPPEMAATSDLLPPYGTDTDPGTWVGGQVDPFDLTSLQKGGGATYSDAVKTPIPLPLETRTARAESLVSGVTPAPLGVASVLLGKSTLVGLDGLVDGTEAGKILRVFEAETNGTVIFPPSPSDGSPPATPDVFLGWYEILDAEPVTQRYTLRRVPEVNPSTGRLFYGVQDAMTVQATSSSDAQVTLHFTLHEAVEELFDGAYDSAKMNSARLVNLIDPEWIERSTEEPNPQPRPTLASGAIWDTQTTATNPGSMLDLGFRAVVFPAKEVGGDAVPDFDNPIDISQAVNLDPTKASEPQFISVDYSSGIVMLSHRPLTTTPFSDVAPNGIVGTGGNNPRGELVLFASFVPYSLEEGQRGASVRVTGSGDPGEFSSPIGLPAQVDAFAKRPHILAKVGETVYSGPGCPSGVVRTLDIKDDLGILPGTGFFELLNPDGSAVFEDGTATPGPKRASTFGYGAKEHISGTPGAADGYTRLYGVYGGGTVGVSATITEGRYIVPRREALLTRTDPVVGEFPTVDFQQDVSYGSAKRTSALRFSDAEVSPQADGSVTIEPASKSTLNDIFRSWVLDGGEVTAVYSASDNSRVHIGKTTVLFRGRRYVLPAATIGGSGQLLDATIYYIYVDSTSPSLAYNVTTGQLPRPDDILLARYATVASIPGTGVTNPSDLRKPLSKIDTQLDILVGDGLESSLANWADYGYVTPHFKTLVEALVYANDLVDGGLLEFRLRILIVGRTDETPSGAPSTFPTLPMVIQVPGLIIEGVPHKSVLFASVQWSTDEPLIDLSGTDDVVFRDVTFVYTNPAASAVAPTPSRYVFTTSGVTERLVIDNCRLRSAAALDGRPSVEGFLYSGDANQAWEDCTFIRNHAISSDFGFWIGTDSWASNCRFEDNNLQGGGAYRLSNTTARGIYVAPGGSTVSSNQNNQFRGNHIFGTLQASGDYVGKTIGYGIGLQAYGRGDFIGHNVIEDTQLWGMILRSCSKTVIHANELKNIWVHVPSVDSKIPEVTAAPDFTQPSFNDPVAAPVVLTAPSLFNVGDVIYIEDAGYYLITAFPAFPVLTSLSLKFLNIQGTTARPIIDPTLNVPVSTGLEVGLVRRRQGIWASGHLAAVDLHRVVTIDSNSITLNTQNELYQGLSTDDGIFVADHYDFPTVGTTALITNNVLVGGEVGGEIPSFSIRVVGDSTVTDSSTVIANNACGYLYPPEKLAKVTDNTAVVIHDGGNTIDGAVFTGNTTTGFLGGGAIGTLSTTVFQADNCVFTGNTAPAFWVTGDVNVLQGNIAGDFGVGGTGNNLHGNHISEEFYLSGDNHVVVGNRVVNDELYFVGGTMTNLVVSDNHVEGFNSTLVATTMTNSSISGNVVLNFAGIDGTDLAITGNSVGGNMGNIGAGSVISGNHIGSTLTVVGATQIMGNNVGTSIVTSPPGPAPAGTVMFGNRCPLYFGAPAPVANPGAGDNI